jgi:F-type H+-transporting ATPase subunit alpha
MTQNIEDLRSRMSKTLEAARLAVRESPWALAVRRVGTVDFVGAGVAHVRDMSELKSEEIVEFGDGSEGMAFNLDSHSAGVVLVREGAGLGAGMEARRTGRVLDAPVGEGLLGRVLDPLGAPLDGGGDLDTDGRRPIERPAPGIMDRAPVSTPLQTGIKVVDALLPVGRGQRELVLGDRQTGKTGLCVDAILNQRDTGVLCVYCAVGKRAQAVSKVVDDLRAHGAMDRAIVVAATEEDPAGLQFAAPYAAMTMAEYFMESGRDTLVVLDDLTRHARAYRQMSLLLRRPPGREAYPGDIFYIHSRLLERSTHLSQEHGGGSLTCLPIIETEAQNVSAYIPTNLISITDGQIYLSPKLFQQGVLPAVDVGVSVSRVGGKAQLPAYRAVAGDLRLTYSQFEELESFSRFGARLDEETRKTLNRGRRVREVLKQEQYGVMPAAEQIATLLAVNEGLYDALDLDQTAESEQKVRRAVTQELPELCKRIQDGERLSDDDLNAMRDTARRAMEPLLETAKKQGEN